MCVPVCVCEGVRACTRVPSHVSTCIIALMRVCVSTCVRESVCT